MTNRQLKLFLSAALVLGLGLYVFDPPRASASGTTYYVDGTRGNNANPGTAALPWKTLDKALASIQGGDTVVIQRGIYRTPAAQLILGPDGLDANHPTVFRAASTASGYARVLITAPDGKPVPVKIGSANGGAFVRVEGIWFGGKWDQTTDRSVSVSGKPIGEGIQVVNCTIFGYKSGLISGATENLLLQGNRFVLNGSGNFDHAIYLSGSDGQGDAQSNHLIVDHNIILGGAGYGIHAWHLVRNAIYTRNFIAAHRWGTALDGTDHLEANNLFWKEKGSLPYPAWGPYLRSHNVVFINNIVGPRAWLRDDSYEPATNRFDSNAFAKWSQLPPGAPPLVYAPRGANQVLLTRGQERAQIGRSATGIDLAIAALRVSFAKPITAIYADGTIEANFAKLQPQVPAASPLYEKGVAWFGQPLNIGTDAAVPGTADEFWAAFRSLGLTEYDRFGNPK